ncbi:RNA polymerase sigma-70 factor [Peribacillus alkalitolerans]|uniref:RNA polymerase sigma-70 factor n=1 Tax=Peribacillus alkalitolerans TaxID=1550385 RepID=UPI0013D889D5|nr:RNA polymerase sigma-70 factor [Peribacillus alkalitolerans]
MEWQQLYVENRPLLFSIAYRILGTVTDAEDIVQDVFLQASGMELEKVENKKAYLSKMVTNRCLDHLKSARVKREVYTGPWLPEPLIYQDNDPISEVMKGEVISIAVLFLLEKLNPIERAVFILREVLEYDYTVISEIVGRNEANCRKIFSRVKTKIPGMDVESTNIDEGKEDIVQNLVAAIHEGNLQKLENWLSNDVILYTDGGGKVTAAIKPVQSRKLVFRFFTLLLEHFSKVPITIELVNVNGEAGILFIEPNHLKTVVSFKLEHEQIKEIYIMRNPDKLSHIS